MKKNKRHNFNTKLHVYIVHHHVGDGGYRIDGVYLDKELAEDHANKQTVYISYRGGVDYYVTRHTVRHRKQYEEL